MVDDISDDALGKRGKVRSVLIREAFFSRTDFVKIKFVGLSFQNTCTIPNLLECVPMYQKGVNLYDPKFSNDILNLKSY